MLNERIKITKRSSQAGIKVGHGAHWIYDAYVDLKHVMGGRVRAEVVAEAKRVAALPRTSENGYCDLCHKFMPNGYFLEGREDWGTRKSDQQKGQNLGGDFHVHHECCNLLYRMAYARGCSEGGGDADEEVCSMLADFRKRVEVLPWLP